MINKIFGGKKKLTEFSKKLENMIYNAGYYRKMCGSNDITVELDYETTEEYLDEHEDGEGYVLHYKITHSQEDECGGRTEYWYIDIEVDKQLNILKIDGEKYEKHDRV